MLVFPSLSERNPTMQVREHMSPKPIIITTDVDVHTALRILQERSVRRLPVTDAGGRVMGIVTERDLLLAVGHYLTVPIDIETIMTRPVVATTPDTPIAEAAMLMVNHKIGGLPVVDDDQRLIGIITESDIFRAFVGMLGTDGAPNSFAAGA
jgi:CBS domain-containing protein